MFAPYLIAAHSCAVVLTVAGVCLFPTRRKDHGTARPRITRSEPF